MRITHTELRWLLLGMIVLSLAGCSLAGTYFTAPSKHPFTLTLDGNGEYLLTQAYSDWTPEKGRWWAVTDDVVVLLPNDAEKKEHYATVVEYQIDLVVIKVLWLSDDLRAALRFTGAQ